MIINQRHQEVYGSFNEVPNNNADLTIDNCQLFKYKAALVGKTEDPVTNTNSSLKNREIVVPLKCLSNF